MTLTARSRPFLTASGSPPRNDLPPRSCRCASLRMLREAAAARRSNAGERSKVQWLRLRRQPHHRHCRRMSPDQKTATVKRFQADGRAMARWPRRRFGTSVDAGQHRYGTGADVAMESAAVTLKRKAISKASCARGGSAGPPRATSSKVVLRVHLQRPRGADRDRHAWPLQRPFA